MEAKPKPSVLSVPVFFFLILFLSVFSSAALELQSLSINHLPLNPPYPSHRPKNPPLNPPSSKPEDETVLESLDSDTKSDPKSTSLTLQLHHIDTLTSNLTADQLFSLRLQRDKLRVQSINTYCTSHNRLPNTTHAPPRSRYAKGTGPGKDFSSSVVSGLAQGSGEYFTRLGVGSPPRYMYMVLDTGSDIIWIQCRPCRRCYTQTDPVFDPSKSHSFASIPCRSPLCQKLDQPGCTIRGNKCAYQVSYGDGSFTIGEYATETMTFRGTKVPSVAIGCGHDNEGLFVGAAGLLGLGRGSLSFPTQAGKRFNQKFSYCLVDRSTSSKPSSMVFGSAAVSRSAVFTPLLTNPKLNTFYYVDLVGISVGGTRVPGISGELFGFDKEGNGGVIVDSGTSVTRLTRPAYKALRDAFRVGAASRMKLVSGFSLFDTCYDLGGKTEVRVPTVVMHFRGADVSLPANNYLIPVDTTGKFCFAFASTSSGLSIIGNIQQQGFRVVFDVAGKRVGFAPKACT